MKTLFSHALFGVALTIAVIVPARAANNRTWISGSGVDASGCGPIANPCRTLQFAHDNTNPGGEIDVKDSAGYGSVTITKAISIVGDGSLTGVLAAAGGNAITINAGTGRVILRGLTVDGGGIGTNGVVLNTAGALDITNCTFRNFTGTPPDGNGIYLQHASGTPNVMISNTTSSYNANGGVMYRVLRAGATASIGIDRAMLVGNANGLFMVQSSGATGPSVFITGTMAAQNVAQGYYVSLPGAKLEIDQSTAADNGGNGFSVLDSASAVIGRSFSVRNGQYGVNAGNSGNLSSFQNNQLFNNGSGATNGTIGTAALQ